jgi:GMP synthase (glutamine-hydrolysing)
MKKVLIIQNDAAEGAGMLGSMLEDQRIAMDNVYGWKSDEADVQVSGYDGLVVLGGVQGAYETDLYPYLEIEIELCREFMEADKPVIGFCLGSQLLAVALGGKVRPNTENEVGWLPVTLSEMAREEPMLASLPQRMNVFHFHGDTIEIPPGCVNLASSEITPCQLFSAGTGVYGFQFHAEIDRPLLQAICLKNAGYMRELGMDAELMIEESGPHLDATTHQNATILRRWIAMI